MGRVIRIFGADRFAVRGALLLFAALLMPLLAPPARAHGPQTLPAAPGKGAIAELEAKQQRRQGDLFIAEGDVDIHYGEERLRADYVEYNAKTYAAMARGRVQLDYGNQHLEAEDAQFNVRSGQGTFHGVRGAFHIARHANPGLLVTDNPLYFEAAEVERQGAEVYVIRHAWITVCDPRRPKWKFYAPRARIRLGKSVALVNANFRLFRVPLIWMPSATAPAGSDIRQSGFLIPEAGSSSLKGIILGDSFYWAPKKWFDTTAGLQYMSRRGIGERVEVRATPWENTSLSYRYFGVEDRGLPDANDVLQSQGGHQQRFELQSLLGHGWRAAADIDELSSLIFRLAFADTYGEAIDSEIHSSASIGKNFRGFSLSFAGENYKNFFTISPETSVVLQSLPEARFSSVEQAPWKSLPFYFGFSAFAGANHRQDPLMNTPNAVAQTEFAPRVTVPLHFGAWLGLTATAGFRTSYYGSSLDSTGGVRGPSLTRNTGEFQVDIRPVAFERVFSPPGWHTKWKHTIEPYAVYRDVTGVNNYSQFIRFGAGSTLTDTNEVSYGLTQRLYRKTADDQPEEFLTWSVAQKHYFDATFGGAIVSGARNVFPALDSASPFAFADGPRRWSPIVNDIKITPGGRYDAEQILEYDPQRGRMITIGTLVKAKPYGDFYAILAHYRIQDSPVLQPFSNQIRALLGYGDQNRKGFSAAGGVSYDLTNKNLQNQIVQVSYNGGCCGIALEYRRIVLGSVRTENQFGIALILANVGTFGNLRRQEKIF